MKKQTFFAILFLAATGLASGCFFELFMTGDGKEDLMHLLSVFFDAEENRISFSETFWQNIGVSLPVLLLTFFTPLIPVLFPISLLLLFFRGLALGFSAAMMMETFGTRGFLYTAFTLVPAGVMQILLFSVLTAVSFHYGLPVLRKKDRRKALQVTAEPYLYTYAAGLAILILICLIQTVLLCTVISP